VVLSKGHEVVGPGYSSLTGAAAKVTDMGENSANSRRVNRVRKMEQHYPSRGNRVNQISSADQRAGWVSRVNWVSWVGNTEQKIGGSSRVANTKS
jgi:hypothetical protein